MNNISSYHSKWFILTFFFLICMFIACSAKSTTIWIGSGNVNVGYNDIGEYDLTGILQGSSPAEFPFAIGGMTTVGHQIWIGRADYPDIFKYDPSGKFVSIITLDMPFNIGGMTTVGSEVWVGSSESSDVYKFDFSGSLLGQVPITFHWRIGGMTTIGNEIWVGSAMNSGLGDILRFDSTGTYLGDAGSSPELWYGIGGMTTVENEVWVGSATGGRIIKYNSSGHDLWPPINAHTQIGGMNVINFTDVDTDGDGVSDSFDNCTLVANPLQRDTDFDDYGNFCDPDFNNDLIVNAFDLAYFKTKFFSTNQDADLNGDGIVNAADLAILKSMFFQLPGPSALAP